MTIQSGIWSLLNKFLGFSIDSTQVSPVVDVEPPDIGDILGQEEAKKGLLVAAYGRHNLLLVGPPGEGKSLLSNSMQGILPELCSEEIEELNYVYQNAGLSWNSTQPPFIPVSPTISKSSLIGGGRSPSPGAVSLAHAGILFLDELPEYGKQLIDSLRIPLESNSITVTRGGILKVYPCDFQLVAAMNPCPCGYDGFDQCNCTLPEKKRYLKKISGAILDRFDMVQWIGKTDLFSSQEKSARSEQFKDKILRSKYHASKWRSPYCPTNIQDIPFQEVVREFSPYMSWGGNGFKRFKEAAQLLNPRKTIKLGRLARSIADLCMLEVIQPSHVEYALRYIRNYI